MRTIRHLIPGTVYHLISRFVGKAWFLESSEDRELYLGWLGRAMADSDWRCISYALMSSHIHLAMVAGERSMASWLKRVHSPFADHVNQQRARIGPVFVRGPSDSAVPPDRVLDLITYIHNNPVRASVVATAVESRWTSHRAYLGLEVRSWLRIDEGLALSGLAREDFDRYVMSNPGDPCRVNLRGMRRALGRVGAVEAGTPTSGLDLVPILARPGGVVRLDPRWFVDQAAAVFGISRIELCSRRRDRLVSAARRVAVLAAEKFGVTGSSVAAVLGISTAAIARIRRRGIGDLGVPLDSVIARVRSLVGS